LHQWLLLLSIANIRVAKIALKKFAPLFAKKKQVALRWVVIKPNRLSYEAPAIGGFFMLSPLLVFSPTSFLINLLVTRPTKAGIMSQQMFDEN
jgi:hypothetical protein